MEEEAAAGLCYNVDVKWRMREGQAVVEYVLAFASLLVVTAILSGLWRVAVRYSDRTENLVSADCP